jgi:hypothetical protein
MPIKQQIQAAMFFRSHNLWIPRVDNWLFFRQGIPIPDIKKQ